MEEQVRAAKLQNYINAFGVLISVLGFIVLFFSLRYTRRSTDAAIKQADTAQKEFVSSQRPWVSLEFNGGVLLTGNGKAVLSKSIYTVKNVGHSVAQNLEVQPVLIPGEGEIGECGVSQQDAENARKRNYGGVLFPDQTIQGTRLSNLLPLRQDMNPSRSFRLVGCVRYQTSVDSYPHYTRMVYFVVFKNTDRDGPFPDKDAVDVDLRLDANGITAN